MSEEKRFEWIDRKTISDNQTDEWYFLPFDDRRDDFVDLLNQQDEEIKELKKENKRLAKNLKVAKDNVDANFRSAQYWRQKFEAIPKSYTCTSGGFGQNE